MTTVTIPALFPVLPGKIHNGIFTCIGPRGHRTVKVASVLEGNLAGKRIVSVMTGRDNERNYTGVAFLNPDDTVNVWSKHLGSDLDKIVRAFQRIITVGIEGYTVEESRHCLRCNRLLTNPESIESGIGPTCRGVA